MTEAQHIVSCLGEEGAEISQMTSKINRFGQHDRNVLDPTGPTNVERLVSELNDLLGVAALCVERGILPPDWQSQPAQQEKKKKVLKFIEYAKNLGAIQ